MQYRAEHGDGKETFEITMAVPVHHCHRVAGLDAYITQGPGQAMDALPKFSIREAHLVAVNNLLLRIIDHRGVEKIFD